MSAHPVHPLLARQLSRLGLRPDGPPDAAAWSALLDRVAATYEQSDQDRYIMERAMAISSDELREATARAEAASRAKSEFLANMSHEIRTPMTAILGYTELLQGDVQSESERADHVRTIRRNGEHLLRIINDILDLSKIEAGKMTVESTGCSPARIVAEVAAAMRVRAGGKGIGLDVDYCFPLPEVIQSDPLRVRQILMNLIGNAVKFTEQGRVVVALRAEGVDGRSPSIRIEIADTGIGMTPGQVSALFRPFNQADTSTTRKFGGTGLGLTISKRLAGMLGGDLSVTSRPGHGSVFSVTLPTGALTGVRMIRDVRELQKGAPEAPGIAAGARLAGRILLVEDGPDNQRLISHMLRKAGAEVEVAEHGGLALARWTHALEQGRPFELILMDMQMPVLDGYETTRELRSRGVTVPVVALTAHAMSSDRDRCMSVGCSDFATKPIDRAALLGICARWLTPRASAA